VSDLIDRFLAGDRRALARLLSHAENRTELGQLARQVVFDRTGRAQVVGVTGPPGAGKSTLINALIPEFRSRGRTVAVLAVDPSSPLTGGATLGDRIRMLENADDAGVYIRSMATRGQMGGLASAVSSAVHLLDAFGFDLILIETVGTGQGEVDIAEIADSTLLLQVPGSGDSIQTIKAGILEIADVLVVNKADQPGSHQVVRDLRNMLLGDTADRHISIIETVATNGTGIANLADAINSHRVQLAETGRQSRRAESRLLHEVERLARERFDHWLSELLHGEDLAVERQALFDRRIDPGSVAEHIIKQCTTIESKSAERQ
jgi:LAO/AO transport system kinase